MPYNLAYYENSWNSGYKRLASNDVLVIDEAGMIGTPIMAWVVKIVLVGDPV